MKHLFSHSSLAFLIVFICAGGVKGQNRDTSCWAHDARVLIDLVNPYEGAPDSNIQLFYTALVLLQKGNDPYDQLSCLNDLSFQFFRKEDHNNLLKSVQAALQFAEQHYSPVLEEGYLSALNNLCFINGLRGEYQKAITNNAELIAREKKRGANHLSLADSYQNQAYYFLHNEEYDEAIFYYKEALALRQSKKLKKEDRESDGNQTHIVNVFTWMGQSYLLDGRIAEAKSSFHRALSLAERLPKNEEYYQQNCYSSSYNLSEIYQQEDQTDSTYFYAQSALRISQQFDVSDDCYVYQVLGEYYGKKGQEAKALQFFDQAIEAAIEEADNLDQYPQIAKTVLAKVNYLNQLGRHPEAINNCQVGLQAISRNFSPEKISDNPLAEQCVEKALAIDLLSAKGDAFLAWYQQGNTQIIHLESAYENYKLAAHLVDIHRHGFASEPAKKRFAKEAIQVYEKAIRTALLLYQETQSPKYTADIFAFIEGNKANILYQSMTDEMAKQYAGLPDSLLEKDRDLNASVHFMTKRMVEEKDTLKFPKLEREYFALKEEHNNLLHEFETNYPKYHQLKYQDRPNSLSALQARLVETDQAIIEYFISPERAYVMAITAQDLLVFEIPNWPQVGAQVQTLLTLAHTQPTSAGFKNDYQKYVKTAHSLYQYLLAPALQSIPVDLESLTIVPDDILCYLPFDLLLSALPDIEKADYRRGHLAYLLEDYTLAYHYSASFMLQETHTDRPEPSHGFIGFAPSFADQTIAENRACNEELLANLPCAQEEVQATQALLGGELKLKELADIAAFRQTKDYKIIHLATHACIDKNDARNNKIFFSDGPLSGADLYQLDMDAELVVLSACNTGSGQLAKGEGVISLSRAFIQAGCKSTLTSLWAVNDCTTADLMPVFYQQLKKGKTKSGALQTAKLTYLRNVQDPAAAHPFYWAAFVTFGDNDPIKLSSGSWYGYLGIGVVLLLLSFFLNHSRRHKHT